MTVHSFDVNCDKSSISSCEAFLVSLQLEKEVVHATHNPTTLLPYIPVTILRLFSCNPLLPSSLSSHVPAHLRPYPCVLTPPHSEHILAHSLPSVSLQFEKEVARCLKLQEELDVVIMKKKDVSQQVRLRQRMGVNSRLCWGACYMSQAAC